MSLCEPSRYTGEGEVYLHPFLTSALHGGELASLMVQLLQPFRVGAFKPQFILSCGKVFLYGI